MSNASGIKIKGLKSGVKALQSVGVPAAEIKAAGTTAGEIVAVEARNLVPVQTGRLRDSIRVGKSLNKVSISAGKVKVPYANPIHWGWGRKRIKPSPFFVKALGLTRDEVYRNYYGTIDKLIADNSTKGTGE